jgi:hypothetical protein
VRDEYRADATLKRRAGPNPKPRGLVMAKDTPEHSAAFTPLRAVYAKEFEKFRSPKPALAAIRPLLKNCQYFDANGKRHVDDLTADFILHATIDPEAGSAVCPLILVNASAARRILPWAAYNIEVRSAVAGKKPPYAAQREWKERALARFYELCNTPGGIAKTDTLADMARRLKKELKIEQAWSTVQGILPLRGTWSLKV